VVFVVWLYGLIAISRTWRTILPRKIAFFLLGLLNWSQGEGAVHGRELVTRASRYSFAVLRRISSLAIDASSGDNCIFFVVVDFVDVCNDELEGLLGPAIAWKRFLVVFDTKCTHQ
jgi:hypothetical protein